jgi:hypothetical protein
MPRKYARKIRGPLTEPKGALLAGTTGDLLFSLWYCRALGAHEHYFRLLANGSGLGRRRWDLSFGVRLGRLWWNAQLANLAARSPALVDWADATARAYMGLGPAEEPRTALREHWLAGWVQIAEHPSGAVLWARAGTLSGRLAGRRASFRLGAADRWWGLARDEAGEVLETRDLVEVPTELLGWLGDAMRGYEGGA